MDQDPVVLALRTAIDGADSVELRLALAGHFARNGKHAEALAEYEAALKLAPAGRDALTGASEAATALGDSARSRAYQLALQGAARSVEPPPEAPKPAAAQTASGPGLRLVRHDDVLEPDTSPAITFADVGGMDEVKKRLQRAFIQPLKSPELYKKYGKSIGGGLVLYGPPGCGKTFLARALAGEIGARFFNVGLSDVLDMWFGQSEHKLHELFENARRHAPAVLFFDEVDALGRRRSQMRSDAGGRTLVNQLLAELDGYAAKNEGVFALGATNHPWDLDPALRRPGRFDRLFFVSPPDAKAREKILELKLAGRPTAPKLDLAKIARGTDGFSGADLEALVAAATELAIEGALDRGTEIPIDDALLARALKDVKPSSRPWFETARNHALFANEGGTYDELLAHLRAMGLG